MRELASVARPSRSNFRAPLAKLVSAIASGDGCIDRTPRASGEMTRTREERDALFFRRSNGVASFLARNRPVSSADPTEYGNKTPESTRCRAEEPRRKWQGPAFRLVYR